MSRSHELTSSLQKLSRRRRPASPELVNRIREAYCIEKKSPKEIAEAEGGMHEHTVYMIARGLHHPHVEASPRLAAWLAEEKAKREAGQ